MVAAIEPAINKTITCPNPKDPRIMIPVIGLLFLAIQASKTAKIGVVQGDDASPKASPADSGASALGTFAFHCSGSGPDGSLNLIMPIRFSPIPIARRAINWVKKLGT